MDKTEIERNKKVLTINSNNSFNETLTIIAAQSVHNINSDKVRLTIFTDKIITSENTVVCDSNSFLFDYYLIYKGVKYAAQILNLDDNSPIFGMNVYVQPLYAQDFINDHIKTEFIQFSQKYNDVINAIQLLKI